jgi:predicted enzyme related to lactoylglutathione lyase
MSGMRDAGKIGWIDITADDAERLRDFCRNVIGWKPENVDMGDYADFNMTMPESGVPAADICHARGSNANWPGQRLIGIVVHDAEARARACTANGGNVLVGPKAMGDGKIGVIEDPSGAVAALYQAL